MDEDKILMRKFQEGDEKSFEALIIKYRAAAVCFAEKYTYDKFIAEDIAQESFAYLYVYKDKYNEKYSFKTYLFTIIHNKSVDYYRKLKKDNLQYNLENLSSSYTIEDIILKNERRNLFKNNISKLNEDYKMAIYLIDYEQFTYKEAGKIMNKNLAQIKILIFRARRKLKLLIEQEEYTIE